MLIKSLIGLGAHVTLVAGCSVTYSHAHTVVPARAVIAFHPRDPAPALHILARRLLKLPHRRLAKSTKTQLKLLRTLYVRNHLNADSECRPWSFACK